MITENNVDNKTNRILLIDDVLAQLDSGRTVPHTECLLRNSEDFDVKNDELGDKSCQATLQETNCSVCAKGALLVAYIRRFNQVSFYKFREMCGFGGGSINNFNLSEYLGEIFPVNLIDEIECLFDRISYKNTIKGVLDEKTRMSLVIYSYKYFSDEPTKRFREIFQRLRRNDGLSCVIDERWDSFLIKL